MSKKGPVKNRKLKIPSKGMLRSIREGEQIIIGGTTYSGRNPEYQMIQGRPFKVKEGLPFVNLNKLDLSTLAEM